MQKLLGMPRNAAIAAASVTLSMVALGLGFLVPWLNAGEDASASAASGGGQSSANASALDGTKISVEFDRLSQAEAVNAFSSQTGLQVQLLGGSVDMPPPFSMHLRNASLLEGFFQLCRDTRTGPNEFSASRISIYGYSGMQMMGVWSISGPFAVVLNKLERPVDFQSAANAGQRPKQLVLNGYFYSEPKTKVMQYPQTLTMEQFTDDKNQPIILPTERINSYSDSSQVSRASFSVSLIAPASPGKKIAIMKGTAPFTVVSKVQSLKTNAPDQDLSKQVGDLGVEIMPLTFASQGAQPPPGAGVTLPVTAILQVRFFRNNMDPTLWNRLKSQISRSEVTVFNAADERLTNGTSTLSMQSDSGDTITCRLSARGSPSQGDPHHVQIDVPAEMRDVMVPFVFKDLVLP